MEHTPIVKLLLKLSPPVMLALLIQSIYNIVDSYFVAMYSPDGLTALSVIFPIQLLITALATGTGTGINILISRMDGTGDRRAGADLVKSGLYLGVFNFFIFCAAGLLTIRGYYEISSGSPGVREQGISYGQIILLFSFGQFMEANCTKILQAKGNMMIPMLAQVTGAAINVALDPVLIFGGFGMEPMGIKGAAAATVVGQFSAMLIVLAAVLRTVPLNGRFRFKCCVRIYKTGLAAIVMQSLNTLYVIGLNLILKQFTEDAVTVLGIYYKLQTFFFIPLMGLQQVILPVISYHYGAVKYGRIKETLKYTVFISCGVMFLGLSVFMAAPERLLSLFSQSRTIAEIGGPALRIISLSFVPAGAAMMLTVYFQGVNQGRTSIFITVLRQVVLLVPLAWIFHFGGLLFIWFTFPVTEIIVMLFCARLYHKKRLPADDTEPLAKRGKAAPLHGLPGALKSLRRLLFSGDARL